MNIGSDVMKLKLPWFVLNAIQYFGEDIFRIRRDLNKME